jgi:hypothetical protein
MFLARRKRIIAQILWLEGLSIAGHIITHSVETRTNTRWRVMWWFTRQLVMWRYFACATSPPLLHYLSKIYGGYFPNSPRFFTCNPSSCNHLVGGYIVSTAETLPTGITDQRHCVYAFTLRLLAMKGLCWSPYYNVHIKLHAGVKQHKLPLYSKQTFFGGVRKEP